MKNHEEVKAEMDQRYKDGTAYQSALPFDTLRGANIRRTTTLLAAGHLSDGVYTLDVGSGEGGISSFWPHNNVVGVEISEVAVEIARKAYPDRKFICSAIENFELGAGMDPFDLVVAQESIEHWTDASRGLHAIRGVMRMGSRLIITTPNRDSIHCRIRHKLGMSEAPYCSHDHIHEFGFRELIDFCAKHGFKLEQSLGVGLLPYWSIEQEFGGKIRGLTDADEEVVRWFEDIGGSMPPEYAFIQCHRFQRVR